jgi:hypothetical protein
MRIETTLTQTKKNQNPPLTISAIGVFLLHDPRFIESPIYSEQIDGLLSTEEHHQLQLHLLAQPDRGDLIKGSGGVTPHFSFSLTRRTNKKI